MRKEIYSKMAKDRVEQTVEVFNTARSMASEEFRAAVPLATQANIIDVGNPILTFKEFANEYLNILINRIAFTWVRNKIYRNPLSPLKKGNFRLGTMVQEIYTNPAKAQGFDANDMPGILRRTNPDTKVAYHQRNREDQYPVTIDMILLRGAFVSWDAHAEMISSITNSMYNGNYIDEFTLMKQTFSSAVDNNTIVVEPSAAADITADGAARKLTGQIKNLVSAFGFPSTKYNNYSNLPGAVGEPIVTFTNPEDIIVLIRADIMNYIDLDVLAVAFNMEKAEFMGNIITVDSFPNENIQAIVMDKDLPMIFDNLFEMTDFWNAKTLNWNFWLTVFQTYSLSPFVNAVAIVANAPTPGITSVTVDPATATVNKGGNTQFTAEVVAVGGANKGVLWTVEGGAAGTTIDASGKLVVATGETATSLTVKATSVFDETKVGTATVTVPQG